MAPRSDETASRPYLPAEAARAPTHGPLHPRLVRESPSWGYRRVHGELTTLGIKVAPSTVWEILKQAGLDPAPERASTTWADFLRSQVDALLACDFIETVTLSGQRQYVLAVIEHATRRVRVLGTTAHPSANWVTQVIRNLVMDLEDAGCRARFLLRDRDGKFPILMDEVLAEAGITTVLTGIRMPRMNSIMERWVQSCRHALLDRCLVWNERHLRHALREYELFYNGHRAHQALAQSRPVASGPGADHGARASHRFEDTPTSPAWRCPARVLTCRLSCVDGIVGRRTADVPDACRRACDEHEPAIFTLQKAVENRESAGQVGYRVVGFPGLEPGTYGLKIAVLNAALYQIVSHCVAVSQVVRFRNVQECRPVSCRIGCRRVSNEQS
ncbi:hypothetical protein [Nonomuraea helvata]|uniref:Integrase catalytic domain-containing protein n=1 Tax=Nonomuraea helvata TaxID=37484 RepID=A0ABV5RTS9_9ACTN